MSETSTAPGVRRGIGSALGLLPLLVCCGLASPAPALTRRTRWAAGILMASLASLALLPPEPAKAQTTVSVSNLDGNRVGNRFLQTIQGIGNAFTTGGATTDRFTLTSVQLDLYSISAGGTFAVGIYTNSSNLPGTQVGSNLTRSGTTTTFNASGITLNGATTYFVVVKMSSGTARAGTETDNGESGTTGWSIADTGVDSRNSNWSARAGGQSFRFAVNATTAASVTPVDPPTSTARLTASQISWSKATLTISGHAGDWWVKRTAPSAGTCVYRPARFKQKKLGLKRETQYTYKAYSKAGCNAADEIASVTFTTLAVTRSRPAVPFTVSNLGQSNLSSIEATPAVPIATSFTTGGTGTDRFTLTNIVVNFNDDADEARVGVWSDSSGSPGTRIGSALTRHGSATTGNVTFNASGITLNGATTYWMVVEGTSGNGPDVNYTGSHNEDAGSASGWEIGNSFEVRNSGTWSTLHATAIQFLVNATDVYVRQTSTLTLSPGRIRVNEGSSATVTASLSAALRTDLALPLGRAWRSNPNWQVVGPDDLTFPTITIPAGQTITTGTITANQDGDALDEYAYVMPTELPALVRMSPSDAVLLTITDDDAPGRSPGQQGLTVTLWVTPNPVAEGLPVTVSAALSAAAPRQLVFPLTISPGTTGTGDIGTLGSITVAAGMTSGSGRITTAADDGNVDNDQFIVDLDTGRLPTGVTAGGTTSVTVTITDAQAPKRSRRGPETAPGPVSNIGVTHNGTSLAVTWDAPQGAATYDVTYTDAAAIAWQRAAWGRAGTGLTIAGVEAGKSYIVGVRAKNALGESAWANSAPASVPAAPDAVTDIVVTHNGSSLTVTWTAPARATHYDVTYSGGGVTGRAAWNRAGTSLEIACDVRAGHENQNCIAGGTTYTVGVRARNAGGASAWADSAPASLAVPGPVTGIEVVHRGDALLVAWPEVDRATHYDVTYSGNGVNARAAWNMERQTGTGKQNLQIQCDSRAEFKNQHCVDGGSSYTVGIRARNAAGAGEWRDSAPAVPPSLSVGDATVAEPATGTANLDFVVTLSRPLPGTVTVDYATSDGTATAGVDYTSTSGTLSFAVGETAKTVSVPVLPDSHDDGGETLTLTLSNASGAPIADGTATGTITNDGPIPKAWNARFGRTVADQVLEGVETRLRSAPTPGVELNLAGERLEWPDAADATQPVAQQVADQVAQWLVVGSGDSGNPALRTLNGHDLLASSSFALASPTSGGGLLSFWGRGSITNFDGREGELSLDGQVTTAMLGTDWSWGQWPDGGEGRRSIAGLLLSRSTADGGLCRGGGRW